MAQAIPFQADTFDTVISTFPSVYIFQTETLTEMYRVLRSGGRLIVLPAVWPKLQPLRWLYRLTGESPAESPIVMQEKWSQPYASAGFSCRVEIIDLRSSILLLIIGTK
jgi:ubiquinone/menaquinone biosynthesis C-methylase UbiE